MLWTSQGILEPEGWTPDAYLEIQVVTVDNNLFPNDRCTQQSIHKEGGRVVGFFHNIFDLQYRQTISDVV